MKNRVLKSGLLTLFVCLAFLLFAGNALAITIKMSVEELTNEANTIIRGTVLDLSSHWNKERTHIVTDVTISAQEYVKGYEGDEVTIQVPGGTVGELGEWVEDVPTFEKGQEVILFLGDDEYFRVVGWHQGKFTVEKDTVLEIGLSVDTFIAGIRQTMAGSAPRWAVEKFPEVSTRGEIGALVITSINPTSGPAHADELGGSGCASDSTSVTFDGSGWPSSQGANDDAVFYYYGSNYLPGCVDSWSSSQIVARVPARASSGDVYIYLDGTWDGPGGPFEVTYSYGGGKWPAGSYPQPMSEEYRINENTSDCSGEGAAVQAADTTWDNVAGADFYFRYGGATSTTAAAADGENSVLWRNLGSSGPIAVCTTRWLIADPHTIAEFDIEFNDYYTWSTTGAAGTMDIQNIATHELGHALTLKDLYGSADSEKTMYGYGSTGETKQRTLEPEDEAGISYIYPASGNTPPTISGLPDQSLLVNTSRDNAIDLWAYASDAEDSDSDLTFTISNSPDPNAGVSIDSNRYIDINPATDWTGTTDVEVQIEDTGGLTDTDTFQVTVTANTPPTISGLPDQTLPVNTNLDNAIDLWAYASDAEDSDSDLTFTISNSLDPNAGVSIDSNRYIDINPATDWTGTTDVEVQIEDTGGLTDTDTFQVTVTANTPPTISGLPDQTLPVNTSLDNAIDLWVYASDAEDSDSDLTFTISNSPDPNAGVSIDSNRYIDINPATDWTGTTDVEVQAEDTGGLTDTDTFQVTVEELIYLPIVLKGYPPLPGSLTSVADACVIQGYPTTNLGDTIDMWAGYDDYLSPDGKIVRSLIKFDVSSIPSASSITNVALRVFMCASWDYPGRSRTITAYRIGSNWSESTVTWNSRPSDAEAYGSVAITHGSFGWYSFDVTNLVKAWVDGTYPNYGVMLRGPEHSGSDSSWRAFYTRESSYDPELVITYVSGLSIRYAPSSEADSDSATSSLTIMDLLSISPDQGAAPMDGDRTLLSNFQ